MAAVQQLLQTDLEYNGWATRELLRACAALTAEQLQHDFGASHGSILRTFRHIYYAERAWLRRLVANALPPMVEVGDQSLFRDPDPEPDFKALAIAWPEVWNGYLSWLATTDDNLLAGDLPSLMSDGSIRRFTRWEIVTHSVNHSTLHRGQIVSLMRALGLTPPNTDIFSYYLARP